MLGGVGGGSQLGVGLIKCLDFQRSLLASSISDPSVLATRGAFFFDILFMLIVVDVMFLLPPERAAKASPCYLFYFNLSYFIFCYLMHIQMSLISYGGNLKRVLWLM